MYIARAVEQPLCGECAPLFFFRSQDALWLYRNDAPSYMSNASSQLHAAIEELRVTHAEEISRRTANSQESIGRVILTLEAPPISAPITIDEIPRDDISYRFLRMNLMPHRRIPGLFLLRYRTFSGMTAFQPCARDIDLSGLFDALRPAEKHGDPIFKAARAWSCVIQASEILPKDIRWVLAMIYNFSHEMLRPQVDEATLWLMRPWLMHWYFVIDKLFHHYGIFASAPEPDWFTRPRQDGVEDSEAVQIARFQTRHLEIATSIAGETVIHHVLPQRDHQAISTSDRARRNQSLAAIQSWLDAIQSSSSDSEHEIFDPTPSGAVLSKKLPSASSSSRPVATSPPLNPQATPFYPEK